MAPKVALLTTCLMDQFYPQQGIALTKILEHFGCTVHLPRTQTCCGRPLFQSGYHEQATELAKHAIELFESFEYVITPSVGCCQTLREQYPRLLRGDIGWDRGMRKLARNTFELIEFLDKVLRVDFSLLKLPQPERLTYHPSCHGRSVRTLPETERLLREIRNLDYRPMPRAEQSCGSAAMFALQYPPLSGALADEAIRSIASTGATRVLCDEPGCVMNLAGTYHRRGMEMKVMHTTELIAEAIKIDVATW